MDKKCKKVERKFRMIPKMTVKVLDVCAVVLISREELIEFPYKFLWSMLILTEVLPNVSQHRRSPHKKEFLYCAVIANDIYYLLIYHKLFNKTKHLVNK